MHGGIACIRRRSSTLRRRGWPRGRWGIMRRFSATLSDYCHLGESLVGSKNYDRRGMSIKKAWQLGMVSAR